MDAILEQRAIVSGIAHERLQFCFLEKVSSTFIKALNKEERLTKETRSFEGNKTFVVVREPYGRLVSAFIDKMFTRMVWWKAYGTYMVREFRYKPSEEEKKCGSDVSFPEFIR